MEPLNEAQLKELDEMLAARKSMKDQLIQLKSPVWDGNLISKSARTALCDHQLVDRFAGWNYITKLGVQYLIHCGELKS